MIKGRERNLHKRGGTIRKTKERPRSSGLAGYGLQDRDKRIEEFPLPLVVGFRGGSREFQKTIFRRDRKDLGPAVQLTYKSI